ncbi:class I SAM-dependent methyltransferase [Flavobacterium sp. ALJ2]|uniref:class I SAM-dependent methyltransferase n=1 Tax=Flavobacterium sp. ALJ2 TaxID=2786960 RepID=UPI00189FD6D3|nr:class I SAM-dependent methyltransferase [Flavobacterium sp. ALJ2]MBF7090746.1 class I SAM-dependent methyltransferase [Flavobacterium sp. ALJ2]
MQNTITDYYQQLAPNYDENRFNNSYGLYIDNQERSFLESLNLDLNKTVDLGCGTGRFLNFAAYGIDISSNMILQSKQKYPEKNIQLGSLSQVPFANNFFKNAFCFHVIMHLDKKETTTFLDEAHRILEKKGKLIFDFPSEKRRKLTAHTPENWHGANELSINEIVALTKDNWNLKKQTGILFFPIHHFPKKLRRFFIPLDNLLCRSFLKHYASYIILILEKK